MSALEYLLLEYAKLYLRNLPRAETHSIPELTPMERKLAELLNDDGWYCDQWPGEPAVTYFCDDGTDSRGMVDRWYVNVDTGQVTRM